MEEPDRQIGISGRGIGGRIQRRPCNLPQGGGRARRLDLHQQFLVAGALPGVALDSLDTASMMSVRMVMGMSCLPGEGPLTLPND
jgi:hypothetical protein